MKNKGLFVRTPRIPTQSVYFTGEREFFLYAQHQLQGGNTMNRKKLMMTTVALGTAYLLKDKDSRQKVMNQLQSLGNKKK